MAKDLKSSYQNTGINHAIAKGQSTQRVTKVEDVAVKTSLIGVNISLGMLPMAGSLRSPQHF